MLTKGCRDDDNGTRCKIFNNKVGYRSVVLQNEITFSKVQINTCNTKEY